MTATIERDHYDERAWVTAVETNPALVEVGGLLDAVNPAGSAALADAFHTLHKGIPRLAEQVDPAHRINLEVMRRLMASPVWAHARQTTVGDLTASTFAVEAIGRHLVDLYRKLAPVADAADRLAAARSEAGEAGIEPGDGNDGAEDAVGAAEAALDAAVDAMGPVFDVGVAAIAGDADEASERSVRAVAGWLGDAGETATMDPARRLDLVRRLTTQRVEDIAKLIGRMDAEVRAQQAANWEAGSDEISGIEVGNDLNRVLPSELLGLCHPALVPDFLDRYDQRRLMQIQRRSRPRLDRGGIVYVEDSSTTMRGDRTNWARALGFTLLRIATRDHRAFRAIVFAGPDDPIVEFDFGDDAATAPFETHLSYLEFTMTGATDFMRPLNRALDYVTAEHTATGRTHSDVVFATDGQAPIDDGWLDTWNAAKTELGLRCYGVAIGPATARSIDLVSDYVTSVSKFTDGTDIGAIFRDVTQPQPITV